MKQKVVSAVKTTLVISAIVLSLCLCAIIAIVPTGKNIQAEEPSTPPAATRTFGTGDDAIEVDVDADGTLVFNRIEQFNCEPNDDYLAYGDGAEQTYTIKPYGYTTDSYQRIDILPAFKKPIVDALYEDNAALGDKLNTFEFEDVLKWRVDIPATVTRISDFSFAQEVSSYCWGWGFYCPVLRWMIEEEFPDAAELGIEVPDFGMTAFTFQKGAIDYDLTIGAAIIGSNLVDSIILPKRAVALNNPTRWTEEQWAEYEPYTWSESDWNNVKINTTGKPKPDGFEIDTHLVIASNHRTSLKSMLAGIENNRFETIDKWGVGTFIDVALSEFVFEEGSPITEIKGGTFGVVGESHMGDMPSSRLSEIVLPRGVLSIGEGAFFGRPYLKDIDFGDSLESIAENAFQGCFTYDTDGSELTDLTLTLPSTLKTLAAGAFRDCVGITSVVIPDEISEIEHMSFDYDQIKNIYLTERGFRNWFDITFKEYSYAGGAPSYNNFLINDNTVIYVDNEPLVDLTVPDGVTEIKQAAFRGYTGLKTVHIGDSVTSIGVFAFTGCKNLTSVDIGANVQTIGASAFESCQALQFVKFPDSVARQVSGVNSALTSIGVKAFKDDVGLLSFVVPSGVTEIGDDAFAGCSKLMEVYNLSELDIVKGATTHGRIAENAIYLDTDYDGTSKIAVYRDVFLFLDGDVPTLVGYTGEDVDLTLPYSYNGKIYDISDYTFTNNITIEYLTIPNNSVRDIGKNAFYNSGALKSVIIGAGVRELGEQAFYSCRALTTVTVAGGLSKISDGAFSRCSSLTDVTLQTNTLKEIGKEAFYGCSSLRTVVIPDTVETVGEKAFLYCSSLTNVKLSKNLKAVTYEMFSNCSALKNIEFPDSVTEIATRAFYSAGLTDVVIGKNVTVIGDYVFTQNNALKSLTFEEGSKLISFGYGNMSYTEILSLKLPDTVVSITPYEYSDYGKLKEFRLSASYIAPESTVTYGFDSRSNIATLYLPDVTDANRDNYGKNMLGFLVRMGRNGDLPYYAREEMTIVAPSQEAYELMVAAIDSFDNSTEFTAFNADKYKTHLYMIGKINYKLYDSDNNFIAEDSEEKLYRPSGASINILKREERGAVWWEYKTLGSDATRYSAPRSVCGYYTGDSVWKCNDVEVPADFVLSQSSYDFVTTLASGDKKIIYPYNDGTVSKVYDGKVWSLPQEYADFMEVTGDSALNVGDYTVTITPKSGYVWQDGTAASKSLAVKITPYETVIVWEFESNWDGNTKVYNGKTVTEELTLKIYGPNGEERTVSNSMLEKYDADGNFIMSASNAGEYVMRIAENTLYAYPNYTLANTEMRLVIDKIDIDITDADNLMFGLTGSNSDLRDGRLYIYNGVPYISAQVGKGEPTIAAVDKSYARWRDREIEIALKNIPVDPYIFGNKYSVDYSGVTAATDEGIYRAVANLSSVNYRFIVTDPEGSALARGLEIVLNRDGTATVYKTWYIVKMNNSLLDSVTGEDYEIADKWVYGETVSVPAPVLEYGDPTAITVTLKLNGETVGEPFALDKFAYYINTSMPAGIYDVIFSVSAVQEVIGDDVIWHSDFDQTFHITVEQKPLTEKDIYAPLNDALKGKRFEHSYKANTPQFFDGVDATGLVKFDYVTRTGFWSTAAASGYYSDGVVITFNVEGMESYDYLSASAFVNHEYAPVAIGTYTVYYQAEVRNYRSLVTNLIGASSDRKNYKFTVVIYDTVGIPEVNAQGLVYTGSKVIPTIDESEIYEVVWTSDDTYINGGTHSVSFKLYDTEHYRWKDSSGKEIAGDTVKADFVITKADNAFIVALNMLGWNFDTFDADVNSIRAATKFLDEGQSIKFSVKKKGETAVISGLDGFTIDEKGKVNSTVATSLNGLSAGEYVLYATVAPTGNYNVLERNVSFVVSKALNSWADGEADLVLPSWIVGNYDPEVNSVSVNAAHGKVNIKITDLDGKEYYNSVTNKNDLKDCEVGKYLVTAWVDETSDYAALAERSFTIEVFDKEGMPWWGVLLIVIGSLGIAAAALWILHEKGVLQMLSGKIVIAIRTKMTCDATIAAVRANKRAEESKKSIAKAAAAERAEEAKRKREEEAALPPETRAAVLEERAAALEEQAKKRVESAAKRAERLKKQARKLKGETIDKTNEVTSEEPTAEAAATEANENTTDGE